MTAQRQPITAFLSTPHSAIDDAVTRAEVLFTGFLVEHNVPMSAADHAGKLFKQMFDVPGTNPRDIVQRYSSGRTKTSHIMETLAADRQDPLIAHMRTSPFSLSTDGSNDRHGSDKPFPIVITCALDNGDVKNHLLSLPTLKEDATGQNIFNVIDSQLSRYNIPWDNCVCFGSDNANVMVGKKNGVLGHILAKHENIFSSGCVCHLIHLAAEKATKQLPVSVENFFQDLYYYTDKSSKRLAEFEKLQDELDVAPRKICKHAPTRWLSLGKSIRWLLEQWDVVKAFFKAECDKPEKRKQSYTSDRKENVLREIRSRTFRLYVIFLDFILPVFDTTNAILQSEKPLVHRQKRIMASLLRDIMVLFVKPSAMRFQKLTDVDLSVSTNLKAGKDIVVGEKADKWIKDSGLPEKAVAEFYKNVLLFYTTASTYIATKFPLNSPVLEHAQVADLSQQDNIAVESLKYFCQRFPRMIPKGSDMDSLQREFCLYQIEDIPSDIMNMDRADNQWNEISKMADASGNLKFCNLAVFMKNILSINHSNASCERVFSMARKNKTDFRSTMGNKCLESLLILKQAGGECHKMSVPLNLVRKCKSATKNALSKSDDCDSCDRWILLFVVTWNAMTFDVFEWPMPSAIPLLWILCPLNYGMMFATRETIWAY